MSRPLSNVNNRVSIEHIWQQEYEQTQVKTRKAGTSQNDSLILVLLVPTSKYNWIIRQLPVWNMIPTPNFMEINLPFWYYG